MKTRFSLVLLLCLCLLMAVTPAYAQSTETMTDLLQSFGMSESESEAFAALAAGMQDVTEEDLRAMLNDFMGEETGEKVPGELVDGLYTDPRGFSMKIPSEWTLQENLIGPTLVVSGPVNEMGFMSTITILIVEEEKSDFLTKTQEEIDTLLSPSLPNYLPIALDDFEFDELPAREMVCMYGASEESMLMQYQLYFNNEGKSFIITMTTLAEEAAHELALDTYDAFLADFVLLKGQGNG